MSSFFRATTEDADLYIAASNLSFVLLSDEGRVILYFQTPLQIGDGPAASTYHKLQLDGTDKERFWHWFENHT
jgi:hypothetical protein